MVKFSLVHRLSEAHAEIERLTAERDEWRERHLSEGSNRYWEGRWREATAENERLREALEQAAIWLECDGLHNRAGEMRAAFQQDKP